MRTFNTRVVFVLIPILAGVALIIFGEALSDLWKDDIKALFQQNKWMLLVFVLLLALVAYFYEKDKATKEDQPAKIDADKYQTAFSEFKTSLFEQYQIRLKTKTANRLPINLNALPTNFGTSPQRAEAYFRELTIEGEDIALKIAEILETHQRLLVIGNPGGGKTTILLFAAINILNEKHFQKLPLLLNLATWHPDNNFEDWYSQNIAQSYGLNPIFVKWLLQQNLIIPFFDGFDEVYEDYRESCLQKMAAYFGDDRNRRFIVSSRKKEYAECKADAPVYAEIEVLPLSIQQIISALTESAHSQAGDKALMKALEQDPFLKKAVETPFYLNTASFLFGRGQRTLNDFNFKAPDVEGREKELVEAFLSEQVPDNTDRKYLQFFAKKLQKWQSPVFELLEIQPSWISKRWKYQLALSMICVVIGGLFGWILAILGDFNRLTGTLNLYFFTIQMDAFAGTIAQGLVIGLLFGIIEPQYEDKILTQDVQSWQWSTFKPHLLSSIFIITIMNIIFYYFSLYSGVFLTSLFGREISISNNVLLGFIISAPTMIILLGTSVRFLLNFQHPYRRFWATALNYFWMLPVAFVAVVTDKFFDVFYLANEKVTFNNILIFFEQEYMYFAGIVLLGLLVPMLLSKFLQHFSLRLALFSEGKIPLRVATFMDRMSDQLIMEDNRKTKNGKKVRGATWRFRHKILQDYFAESTEYQ